MLSYLVALLSIAVVVLYLRLRWTRRHYARRLAAATGHPSALRRRDRAEVAGEVAVRLAELGLVTDRSGQRVWARALAGEYAITVLAPAQVQVAYRADGSRQLDLGILPGVAGTVRTVAEHADLAAPA